MVVKGRISLLLVVGLMLCMTIMTETSCLVAASPSSESPIDIEELKAKAKSEGGVIYTYGMPDTWANYGKIFAEFERLYGIKYQDIDMGSAVVLSRMGEENAAKNDIADVSAPFGVLLAEQGLTADYKVSVWDSIPAGQKGVSPAGSVWNSSYKGTIGWIVNTLMVKNVPTKWSDLVRPEYKGLVSYMDPRATASGICAVEAVSTAVSGDPYDYAAGTEFLGKLHKLGQIAMVDPKVTVAKFQRGEVGILVGVDYNLLKWADELGIPSQVVIPEDGTVSYGHTVVIAKNAPHPYTARLFLEFLMSEVGQQLFAEAFVVPIREDVKIPPSIAAKMPPASAYEAARFIDYVKEAEISEALAKSWAEATGQ
jgi:putative spermidine/putrescine transport system substrate-binding protein